MSYFIKKLRKSRIASATLAAILAFSVLLSTFSGLAIFAEGSALDIWESQGAVSEPKKGGEGNGEDDAVLINTPEELAYVIKNGGGGKYYKLTTDIYLNDPAKINWATGEKLDANYSIRDWYDVSTAAVFNGYIDGDGHTIYGMYLNTKPATYVWSGTAGAGLISKATSGEVSISNLGIDKAYVNYTYYASAFIGSAANNERAVTVDSCYVGADVSLTGVGCGAFVGVAVGTSETTISNCYNLGTMKAIGGGISGTTGKFIGFIGEFYSGKVVINNSFNANGPIAQVTVSAGSGNNYETVQGKAAANATVITDVANMKGADVLTNAAKMPKLGEAWTDMGDGKYPVPWAFSGKVNYDVWDGTQKAPTKGGDGSAEDKALVIKTPEELAYVIANGGSGKYYKLGDDIYLNDPTKINWATGEKLDANYSIKDWNDVSKANVFKGYIDGDGHTIYGMYLNTNPSSYVWSGTAGAGLISKATNGEVKISNLGIDKAYVKYTYYASALIGSTANNTSAVTIDSCYVGADVSLTGVGCGAFVGVAAGTSETTISNCYNLGTLKAIGGGTSGTTGKFIGFIGEFYSGKVVINNSFNANGPIAQVNISAGSGNNYETVQGKASANATVIADVANMKGADVLTNAAKMPNLGVAWTDMGDGNYPVPWAFSGKDKPIIVDSWDGTQKAPTKGGDGSAEDKAIIIETPEELAYVIANGGSSKYYKLAADIYLNDPAKINWATGEKLDANYATKDWNDVSKANVFKGYIDGDGHTIYGMYLNTNPASYAWSASDGAGLISKATNGEVKISNLGIDKAYVNHKNYASAFIGSTANNTSAVTIDSCYVGADVSLTGVGAAAFVGVAVGTSETTISNCYNLGTLKAIGGGTSGTTGKFIGFIGEFYSGKVIINNSFNANGPIAQVTVSAGSGNNYETVQGKAAANATVITDVANMKGADVLTNAAKMPNLGAAWTDMGDGNYPVPWAFSDKDEPIVADVWDGTQVAPTKGGDGSTEDKAIIIETPEELAYVIANGGGEETYYKLANDIYLNKVEGVNWSTGASVGGYAPRDWYDVSTAAVFKGYIDGDGHTIYGLYLDTKPSSYLWSGSAGVGLISKATNGEVEILNLGIDKAYVHYTYYASALIGSTAGNNSIVTIDSCYVGANVMLVGNGAAAFIGNAVTSTTSINNSYNLGTTVGKGGNGIGFMGEFYGAGSRVITNSYNANGPIIGSQTLSAGSGNNYETVQGRASANATLISDVANMKGADVLSNEDKMPNLGEAWTDMGDGNYPVPWAFSGKTAATVDGIWNGTKKAPTKGGDGSAEDKAIIIETPEELAYVIANGGEGKYYKLAADIYLNDPAKVNWLTGEKLEENYTLRNWYDTSKAAVFKGYIDGDGHTVYGMYLNSKPTSYAWSASDGAGLISKATDGEVKISNLGIDKAYVNHKCYAAAFVGSTANNKSKVTIEKSYVGSEVSVTGVGAAAFVGVAVSTSDTKILHSYNRGTMKAIGGGTSGTTGKFIGFVGEFYGGSVIITNSYNATGPIAQVNITAGSGNNYEAVKGKDSAKAILISDSANMQGADVLDNAAKMPKLGKEWTDMGDGNYPVPWAFSGKEKPLPGDIEFWDGITRTEPTDSDNDGIIEINNGEELAYVVYTGGAGKKYELTKDIYLNDVSKPNWEIYASSWFLFSATNSDANRAFNGYLEGNGHTVYGLYRNDEVPECTDQKQNWRAQGVGLFPIITTEATIRNVHIREAKISANTAVGAIAGKTHATSETPKEKKALIIGCSADETVSLHGWVVGGFVGGCSDKGVNIYYSYSTANCSNTGLEGFCNAFIGDIWNADCQMVDCYYIGENAAHGKFSFIATYGTGTTKEANGLKIVSKASMFGARAKTSMKNLDWTVWTTADGKTPQLTVVPEGKEPPAAGEGKPGRKWYGLVASKYDGGTGTKDDPYLISTPEQLARLVTNLSKYNKDTYYKITHDIILNDTSYKGWEQDALQWYNGWRSPFVGHLDGGGHIISGLYINDAKPNYSALFSIMGHDSTIKRLGIVNSKIVSAEGSAAMCAPLIAFVEHWQPSTNPQYKMPVVSECFADSTVYIEGTEVGGLIAGAPSPIKLENCYSTAELFSTKTTARGTLIGGAWGNDGGPTLVNCYGTNSNRDRLVAGNAGKSGSFVSGKSSAVNCYADGPGLGTYINSTIIEYMKGDNAREHMAGLDYNKVWKIVKGGTPVLRCFKNAEKYSCKRDLQKVNITFITNGGSECESMSGYPRLDKLSADELPTPKKYGYKFAGWYYFSQLDLPYDLEVYPDFDLNLYAKWEAVGFTVTFENTPDPVYDYNVGTLQVKPGVKGYSPRYTHGGIKSMHTLPDSSTSSVFLLSYENTLEVGQEYEVNFWVTTDTANQAGEIRLAHAKYGDINDDIVGEETAFEYGGLIQGVWKKYTAKIVANAPYLLIKAPVGASLYFDDIQVVPTGEEGKLGQLDGYKATGLFAGMNLVLILSIAGGVILLGGGAVIAAVVIKKRKAKAL